MIKKPIIKVWTFRSKSSDTTYETLQYNDMSTSCNCMGWTRRVANDGSRSCTHTRSVDMDTATAESIKFHSYIDPPTKKAPQPVPVKVQAPAKKAPVKKVLKASPRKTRKIEW